MEESHLSVSALANFVILAGGLTFLLRKPLSTFVLDRHEKVKKAVSEAEQLRQTVDKMAKEYEQKLSGLDSEISQIMTEARAEAERERVLILKRAEEQAQRIREEAERFALMETERVKRKLESEVIVKAVAQARTMLQSKVTASEHQHFVNELVTSLEGTSDQKR